MSEREETAAGLARTWDVSLDALRRFLSARRDLRDAGRWVGSTRVYGPAAAEAIRAAFAARRVKREAAPVATA